LVWLRPFLVLNRSAVDCLSYHSPTRC
jgi:hypothetical protein